MFKERLGPLKRLGLGLLRYWSKDFRAIVDLMDPAYEERADWQSGLESGSHLLYALVRCLRPNVVVETGSARGKSTCSLALACRHNFRGKVYAIDPHNYNPWSDVNTSGFNEHFLRNRIKEYGLDAWCEIMKDTSANAAKTWNLPVDLLFIDGDHTYEGVKADFEGFQPWLTDQALVVFHDTTWDFARWQQTRDKDARVEDLGVPQFMAELREAGYSSITLPAVPGITVLDPHVGGFDFAGRLGWPIALKAASGQ